MNTFWKLMVAGACIAVGLDADAQDVRMMRTEKGFVERITASYTVDSAGELAVDADFGFVRIETSSGNKVEILVEKRLKAGGEDLAHRIFEEVEVVTKQQGSDVHIRVDNSRWFKRDGVSLAIMVQVPATYNLDVKTSGNSIEIGDLEGEVMAKTAGGSIRIGATKGDVTAKTMGGSIRIGPTEGGVYANTLGGSIHIGDARGDVSARTLGGSIRIGIANGDVSARTLGGNITVESASGKVSAKTLGGKVRVGST